MLTDLMVGPHPPADFEDNGCGPKTRLGLLKLIVPDHVRVLIIGRAITLQPACRHHDYAWSLAARGEMITYAEADAFLFANLTLLIVAQGGGAFRATLYPLLYWLGVRLGSVWVAPPWRRRRRVIGND